MSPLGATIRSILTAAAPSSVPTTVTEPICAAVTDPPLDCRSIPMVPLKVVPASAAT